MDLKHPIITKIIETAKKTHKKIVFAETDKRILKAAIYLKKQKICTPIIIGNKEQTIKENQELKLQDIEFIEPDERFEKLVLENRKGKITLEDAKLLSKQPNYFSAGLLHENYVHGMVCGATYPSADTFRAGLQIIKTKEQITASTYFLMLTNKGTFLFADCALNIKPNEMQLADIAIETAKSSKKYGLKPKIAMLSFSTNGSASHEDAQRVKDATEIVKQKEPKLEIDGEMQVDAALDQTIREQKFKNSNLKSNANIFIFPDLNSANIGYKLVQRFSNALAIGPISQGFNKPINDLSRGCSVEEIIVVAAITCLQ